MVGVFTKTVNAPGRAEKDIPALWQRFMEEDVKGQIKNAVSEEVLCAYTEYESDHLHPYTTVVGLKVENLDNIPEGMKGITIKGGEYAKFLAKGDLKGPAVIKTWMDIWKSGVDRTYQTDFEVYGERSYPLDNGEADIYIAVK